MNYFLVGLGNPGEEYEGTRHNSGRIIMEAFRKKNDFPEFELDKKAKALVSTGKIGKHKVTLIEPETFMNNSGKAVIPFVKNKKDAARTIVVYDDLDLSLGSMKISFNRGSGGHKGIESVIKALKTREFARLRVGISSATPGGKLKKPTGDKAVHDFIIGKFKDKEAEMLKKVSKNAIEALRMIIEDGKEKAMGAYN